MSFENVTLKAAHKRSIHHRPEIESSVNCGCFYCCTTFIPSAIKEWVDDNDTAICPQCDIDSIVGDASGYPVTDPEFLSAMHQFWFERTVDASN